MPKITEIKDQIYLGCSKDVLAEVGCGGGPVWWAFPEQSDCHRIEKPGDSKFSLSYFNYSTLQGRILDLFAVQYGGIA